MKKDRLDMIRGSLIGGAAGDALGFAIEFDWENKIFARYGKQGITEYELQDGKALISDDTQMTLFTATGILGGETRAYYSELGVSPCDSVAEAYQDWLTTQEMSYSESRRKHFPSYAICPSWLLRVPDMYDLRAPGNTCLSALHQLRRHPYSGDYIKYHINNSKGCGGVMRIAPMALHYAPEEITEDNKRFLENIDMESAQMAAITHGHSLGYMPAAVVAHIIARIMSSKGEMTLKEMVLEARDTAKKLFKRDKHLKELVALIDLAVELSEGESNDLENIHRLGAGWVAEETMAIAIYCALKYQDDFSKALIASVNHSGDSDSTGAVTGNILGAWVGYEAMDDKWKTNLELKDVILEIADDLSKSYRAEADDNWIRKYGA